ncbi:hypothetical protein CLV80_10419 [Yoonia maritima]|uniref:Uncharacterized protein n=1 Tax=Yoonia maritima TaxID=1435347 RepID=A0A2T0VZX4_9RHOB|nr:hypothetical protein [Yoonia maritima]PRY78057.1 hypothetical protein CLV80_10419 [Yoonia maritima]
MPRLSVFSIFCVVVVFLFGSSAWANQDSRTIRNDGGGNVNEYLVDLSFAILSGEKIQIDGWCASACTLYLASTETCVTPNARLGFHAPRGGTDAENKEAARVIAARLPATLSAWYLKYGAELDGNRFVALTGAQIVDMGAANYCT